MTIRTMIVDDSMIIRKMLRSILSADPNIDVIATAPDPYIARNKIVELKPDVITLDLEMPRMDGLTFLKKLMKGMPTPVIIVSGITEKGCALSMEALEAGALDVIEKPSLSDNKSLQEFATRLCDKIVAASKARVRKKITPSRKPSPPRRIESVKTTTKLSDRIIAIGASTGGTEAIKQILTTIPVKSPPILIVQHMPGNFTGAFARRINAITELEVLEAQDGMEAIPGRAVIANGAKHLTLNRLGFGKYRVHTADGALVCRHKPSVEVLFNSVCKAAGNKAIGVMLTGMGKDGAVAMQNLHDSGANTIAQDENSCVVFGMPKEAIKLGAIDKVVPLDKIPETIFSFL